MDKVTTGRCGKNLNLTIRTNVICTTRVAVLDQTPTGFWDTNGSPNLGQKTRSYSNQQKKNENLQNCKLCCTGWPQNKKNWKKVKRRISTSTLLGNFKKNMEHEGDDYINRDWCIRYSNWRAFKGLQDLEVGERVETIQTKSLIKNGQNTEKSPGDWRRLAVKDHQLTLMCKTLKE